MKYKYRLLAAVLLSQLLLPSVMLAQDKSGTRMLFDDDWQFHKGDVTDGIKGVAITGDWKDVQLPHDWSIEGPFSDEWASATAYLPGGIGWYNKKFTLPARWNGQQIYIYFDGVYKNSEVWINDHYLGKRPNGFIAFEYELTPYLNRTGENTITVKVDHSQFADSRWYTGSGIYRDVYLVAKNPVHFDLWGIAFTTPKVTAEKADVQVNTCVISPKKEKITIKTDLLDATGRVVASAQKQVTTADSATLSQLNIQLYTPKLWSTEHPYLYTLRTSIVSGGKQVDAEKDQVGIRNIHFDANNGLFLNGVNTKLKGVCIHDDAGALGVAVPEEVWVRRLQILKDGGVNAIRLSHNPHAAYLYDLFDKMGFLVMDEAFDEWALGKNKWIKGRNVGTPSKDGYNEYFKQWADRDIRDMVLRDRNHPSVILWSIGNEIDYPNDPYSNPVLNEGKNPQIYGRGYLPEHPPASEITPIAKQLVKAVKAADRSRPVTAALAGIAMSNEVGYPEALDVVGYNYQEYLYAADHRKYPNRVIYGSENGMQLQAWLAVDTNKYISGQFLWTGIDYLGEANSWPERSNSAGLIDLAGFRKTEYYYRQSMWATKPMVYIAALPANGREDNGIWSHRRANHTWNWPQDSKVRVECFTNCDTAELLLNGKSLGLQTKSNKRIPILSWEVNYQPGELSVRGYKNGKVVCANAIKTAGNAEQLAANADKIVLKTGTRGLSQIEIAVTDKNGVLIYNATNEIQVTVSGPAKLLGLESGSNTSHESYQSDKRAALNGHILAYVQTSGKAGTVNVQITSPGLKSTVVHLKIQSH
jgi:beta-galactosidase/beta-glucuronidase